MPPFRMKEDSPAWLLAVELLEQLGFVVTVLPGKRRQSWWTATSADLELVADGPLKLLGLLQLYEQRGERWRERVPREVRPPEFDTFAELDLSQVFDAEQLHDLLERTFGLPPGYRRNWDAFDECLGAASQSSLPDVLRVIGYQALLERLPGDARRLRECFDGLDRRGRPCRVEWLH